MRVLTINELWRLTRIRLFDSSIKLHLPFTDKKEILVFSFCLLPLRSHANTNGVVET